jgi:hypothetical protein
MKVNFRDIRDGKHDGQHFWIYDITLNMLLNYPNKVVAPVKALAIISRGNLKDKYPPHHSHLVELGKGDKVFKSKVYKYDVECFTDRQECIDNFKITCIKLQIDLTIHKQVVVEKLDEKMVQLKIFEDFDNDN